MLGYIAEQQADEETGRLIGSGGVWASIDQPLLRLRRTCGETATVGLLRLCICLEGK
ncbi:MAG: hypothetical protein MSH66_08020 [Bacteroidales bacterium]|nr:hypothetical protein [Bacteroidales bacterium]